MYTPVVAISALLVAVSLHYLGVWQHWYGTQGGPWWFDDLTHMVSGSAVALALVVFLPVSQIATLLVFWTLLAIWEIVEYLWGPPTDMWVSWKNMFYDIITSTTAALLVIFVL